ncbi:MAG: 4Fe-4S dicluster domain-containing protein [Proteobacteria bacterium]|nr:4Fe-4S dicluster domain-containing protein [Pseudomonadota bacterium]
MKLSNLSFKQLIEIDACTRCGECLKYCPVYAQRGEEDIDPRGKIQSFKSFIRSQYGLWARIFGPKKLEDEKLKKFSEMVYRCTLCGECSVSCPVSIDAKNLWLALRETLTEMGHYPAAADRMKANLIQAYNISGVQNEERTEWLEFLDELPDHQYQKEKAHVAYFVGCVASFFPLVQRIPQAVIGILDRAGVDFTLLGGEEWCCGFPLIGAGMKKEAQPLFRHNLEKMQGKGVEKAVFACPSCYHTWMEEYETDIEIFHSTQFIKKLIKGGKISFREKNMKVTYHDPCDLGRASEVYEPPREILQAIPGVELVEMAANRDQCKCCGGGGNLEMVDPELSAALAQEKIKEIQATGAETVITACQQCVRTIMTTARRNKIPIRAMDVTEFVLSAMN